MPVFEVPRIEEYGHFQATIGSDDSDYFSGSIRIEPPVEISDHTFSMMEGNRMEYNLSFVTQSCTVIDFYSKSAEDPSHDQVPTQSAKNKATLIESINYLLIIAAASVTKESFSKYWREY